jgi:transcriptional regulator with XRE-family HTH domain
MSRETALLLDQQTRRSRLRLSERVRELRRAKGLTLRELSRTAGFAPSTLSKIENGQLSASFDSLVKLAEGLGVDFAELFAGESALAATARRSITAKGGGRVHDTGTYQYELLCTDLTRKQMIPLLARVKAGSLAEFGPLIRHPGEEFVYVLDGPIELRTEFYEPRLLKAGDCAYFDSTMGHALLRAGERDALVLWVCTFPMPRPEDLATSRPPET